MTGVNLMPSACRERPLQERAVFGAIYPNDAWRLGAPSQHVRGRWVREGDFKLIVPGPAPNPLPLALYDLKRDPDERTPDQLVHPDPPQLPAIPLSGTTWR